MRCGARTCRYHYEPSSNCIPHIGKFPIGARLKNRGGGGRCLISQTWVNQYVSGVFAQLEGGGCEESKQKGALCY